MSYLATSDSSLAALVESSGIGSLSCATIAIEHLDPQKHGVTYGSRA